MRFAVSGMTSPEQVETIHGACRGYLDLLGSASGEPHARQARLAEALDRLCAAYNQADDGEPDTEELDTPRAGPEQFGEQAAVSFPELSFYPIVDPLEGFKQEVGQGWGLDDLTDIAIDLTEVLWLLERGRINDGIWTFRWGYQSHWGLVRHRICRARRACV
jgi:hypothetical protein